MNTTIEPRSATATVRALTPEDLDAVVAIDAATEGRTRRSYIERRLQAAQREPALHAQFAAVDAQGLGGFLLARLLQGEFGRSRPALRIELVGVRAGLRGQGVGRRLFAALAAWGARHGGAEVHTLADWRRGAMLGWFGRLGFELAPHHVVECSVDQAAGVDDAAVLVSGSGPEHEVDFGRGEGNDHERLARGQVDVRSMLPQDLDAIVRIDRELSGADRRAYIAAQLAEAQRDTAVRVSLAAHIDGALVGYLMARADLGDFGRTEPVAVIDTLGVDPGMAHRGVGRALLAQLFAHLGALRVERAETLVPQRDLALLGFLYAAGFGASPRLAFTKTLDP